MAEDNSSNKLAVLSPFEQKTYETCLAYHLNRGHSQRRARELAWCEMQDIHPRLREFDGIQTEITVAGDDRDTDDGQILDLTPQRSEGWSL